MGFKTLEEIVAYQVAGELKAEVYRLLREHPRARADWKFADQLTDAVASVERNIAEGFGRFAVGDFSQYLRVARGSAKEVQAEIKDGIQRGHFSSEECRSALALVKRVLALITGLLLSLRPFLPARSSVHGPRRKKHSRRKAAADRSRQTGGVGKNRRARGARS